MDPRLESYVQDRTFWAALRRAEAVGRHIAYDTTPGTGPDRGECYCGDWRDQHARGWGACSCGCPQYREAFVYPGYWRALAGKG